MVMAVVRKAADRLALRAAGWLSGTRLFVRPGHYYSPIVDPDDVRRQRAAGARTEPAEDGVGLDAARMETFFRRLATHFPQMQFSSASTPGRRYYTQNSMFGIGDAAILAAMIREIRPSRIIEVGSGFSSAVTLDTLDQIGLAENTRCTFIDPDDSRLVTLLGPSDRARVQVLRQPVQATDRGLFAELQAGDILFLDTTHVAKTGSDLVFELFEILPTLKPGVIVHFHDMFAGFEYPDSWALEDNRSWNEVYVIRAFLMYNSAFEILYFNDWFARERRDVVAAAWPAILDNPGGGLWLRRVG